jgi:sulfite reductase alpha subunit-like flavoprotein
MEQQLRRNLGQIAKQRIGLSDAQMTRLEQTSRHFDERRRALALDERAQRLTLRQELLADAKADQDRVAAALDRLHELQRQRVDLQIEEQREFATFMSPVQRAKYAALQEQVRRRVEELRRQRPDSGLGVGRP